MKPLPNSRSRPYKIWAGMKGRCKDKRNKNYGGKGITYDHKWEVFKDFWNDMGDTYREGLTLDRLDNKCGYNKTNCRWATYKEQMRNFSGNTHITYNGETKILSDWAYDLGITKQSFIGRLKRFPNDNQRIFAKGKTTRRGTRLLTKSEWKDIEFGLAIGQTQTSLAEQFGTTQSTISKYVKRHEIKIT